MWEGYPVGMGRRLDRHASVPVHALGLVIVGLAVAHVLVDDDPLTAELAEAAILLVFAGATFFVGRRVAREEVPLDRVWRIVSVTLASGLVVGALSAVYVAARVVAGEPTSEHAFALSVGWSVGAGPGALVGYYYDRLGRSLSRERDLTNRLTVLQRVLRHNLRNEVTMIRGAAEDVRRMVDDEAIEGKLDVVVRHSDRVTRLSEQSGRLTRVWQTDGVVVHDAGGVVDDARDWFRRNHPDVPLAADSPDGCRFVAHPDIGLAVREALDNAATHNDEVEVSLSVRDDEGAAGVTTIEVEDTGSGIPLSELRPLRSGAERPMAHTSGLGLWLVYWLVELSGGELDVGREGGAGTTVELRLPTAG